MNVFKGVNNDLIVPFSCCCALLVGKTERNAEGKKNQQNNSSKMAHLVVYL